MPGFPKMADGKGVPEAHVVITQVEPTFSKPSNTKKYVILGVSIVLGAAIILAAILIGIYFFTEAQKELVKYTLEFSRNAKQDVSSDPNSNIVTYEIQNPGQKTWVINDFNRDIQVVKIQTNDQTNCYVSALNRTRSQNPSQITGPETKEVNKAATLTYVTSGTPISDTSFLAKAARDTCSGIDTYWLYPQCTSTNIGSPPAMSSTLLPSTTMFPSTKSAGGSVTERPVDNSPWYIYWSYQYNANITANCVTGCCKTVCACSIRYYWYYSAGSLYCTWVASSCPDYGIYDNPVSQACTDGPTGLTCPNNSPAELPDC